MPAGAHSTTREMGTAIAVLAFYVLLLLAPWHQAAALQHDLSELGYASAATVDICGDRDAGPNEGTSGFKCPMAGIAKFDFAGIVPALLALELPRRAHAAAYAFAPLSAFPARHAGAAQPRAPPAAV